MTTPTDPTATAVVVTDNKFKDEDKEDSPEQAVFVSDKGDGTASLMKPRKPTIHHRARDSHFDSDGNRFHYGDALDEQFDDDDDETINDFQASKWHIVSAAIFVFSSLLYLAMACMIMDTYWWYKDVPRFVYWADDDSTWWNYFVNCTDDGFIPENVTGADDDYTWMEWYNYSAFHEDDNVWLPDVVKEPTEWPEDYVSKYMLLYFWAAFGFLVTGVIEIKLAHNRKSPLKILILYYLMMLAAMFGLASAILTNKHPLWSNICNCISVNLWALEALYIVLQRVHGNHEAAEYDQSQGICGWSIKMWFWVADISFLFGTSGDAITSWFYIFQYDNWILGICAIIFASFWQICAFVYLAVAIFDFKEYKNYFVLAEEYEKELKEMEVLVKKDGTTAKDASDNSEPPEATPGKENDVVPTTV